MYLKVVLTNLECKRKKLVVTPGFLAKGARRIELSFIEMRKSTGGAGLGGNGGGGGLGIQF